MRSWCEPARAEVRLITRETRAARNDADLFVVVKLVVNFYEAAMEGFAPPLDMPFGLGGLHQHRRSRKNM